MNNEDEDTINSNKSTDGEEPTKNLAKLTFMDKLKEILAITVVVPLGCVLMLVLNAAAYLGALVSAFSAFLCFIDLVLGRPFKDEIVMTIFIAGAVSVVGFVLLKVTDMDIMT